MFVDVRSESALGGQCAGWEDYLVKPNSGARLTNTPARCVGLYAVFRLLLFSFWFSDNKKVLMLHRC